MHEMPPPSPASTPVLGATGSDRPSGKPVAVALDYDAGRHAAPQVVASGHGGMAERIVAVAEASGVPVRRDGDLAQVLGKLDVGETIPVEVYAAVAEILSYLYRLNGGGQSTAGTAGSQVVGGRSSDNRGERR